MSYGSDMKSLPHRLKTQLPDGWTARRLVAAMADRHPHLAPLFGKDVGLELMFTESRILLAAMSRLLDQGVAALPMHDGMMVARGSSDAARKAMEEASMQELGSTLPVAVKA